jgi:hypothetical protein
MTPPELGLARVRIPGFQRLSADEQLRSAALALRRDFGVLPTNLHLAVRLVAGVPDDAWVAYASDVRADVMMRSTNVFAGLNSGRAYWVGAPGGYIVAPRGAVAIECGQSDGFVTDTGLPALVAAMFTPENTAHAGAGQMTAAVECVLVERDKTRLDDNLVAMWQAASGVAMFDGSLPDSVDVPLSAVPSLRPAVRPGRLDVALRSAAIAGFVCAVLAGTKLALISGGQPTIAAPRQLPAGELLERVSIVAPEVLSRTQSATYASGAWVFGFGEALDPTAQKALLNALEANGLQAQATGAPTPRLRVYLAP